MAVFVGALLWPSAAVAQKRINLPIETALETPRVELDLTDARVVITVDSDRPARFSARAADPDIDRDVSLERTIAPQAVTWVRRNDNGSDHPTIVVEINLRSDQVLAVTGKRLDLAISHIEPVFESDPASEPHTSSDEPDVKIPGSAEQGPPEETSPAVSVDVEDSALRAAGLRGMTLAATRSIVDLDITSGPLQVELDESEVHARGLFGPVNLRAVASKLTIEDAEGDLTVDLEGGHLSATRGRLRLKGDASNAGIVLVSLTGSVQLGGSDSFLRIADAQDCPIRLTGRDLDIELYNVGGPVSAKLASGRIQGETIASRLDLELAAGAKADLRNLESDVSINLTDEASANVTHVEGHTRIQLDSSELEVSDLKSLELRAQSGVVTGTDIRNLTHLEVTDTELDITLPGIQGKHDILLRGATTAVVRLPTPCRVVAKMPDTTNGDQLRVTGCLLDFDGTVKRPMQRGIDGQPPIRLNATLDGDATLEVHGLP